jgi:DNA invertase Pin-like site-specific DNA recombinase
MKIGYARVSTIEQDTALQLAALRKFRCDHIVEEKRSAVKHRPHLDKLLSELERDDLLIVYKLDRLARSLQHLLSILDRLKEVGAGLKSLTEPIDTSSPAGMFTIQVLGAAAQFEREIIRERTIAGQLEAFKAGKQFGRLPRLTPAEHIEVIEMVSAGMAAKPIGEAYGLSRSRIRQIYKEATGHRKRYAGPIWKLYSNHITTMNKG